MRRVLLVVFAVVVGLLPAGSATAKPAQQRQVIVTGQVTAGSFGCVALRTGDRRSYTLSGGVSRWGAYVGDTVRVRGRVRTDVFTMCMTGPVLEVSKVFRH